MDKEVAEQAGMDMTATDFVRGPGTLVEKGEDEDEHCLTEYCCMIAACVPTRRRQCIGYEGEDRWPLTADRRIRYLTVVPAIGHI